MNNQPAANKRWHQSFNELQICSSCQLAFWHQGKYCPHCGRPLEKIQKSLLNLQGEILSFSYYPLSLEKKEEIKRWLQIVAVVRLKVEWKNKIYPLYLTLPFGAETKPREVRFGSWVRVVLRRQLANQPNEPLNYIPKIVLTSKSNQ